jgi:hypothetical protein
MGVGGGGRTLAALWANGLMGYAWMRGLIERAARALMLHATVAKCTILCE